MYQLTHSSANVFIASEVDSKETFAVYVKNANLMKEILQGLTPDSMTEIGPSFKGRICGIDYQVYKQR